MVNDEAGQCDYPLQPVCSKEGDVCTDKQVALFIAAMGEKIEICRELLNVDN